jgi:hypothetical protein
MDAISLRQTTNKEAHDITTGNWDIVVHAHQNTKESAKTRQNSEEVLEAAVAVALHQRGVGSSKGERIGIKMRFCDASCRLFEGICHLISDM